jgi:hypothetical protein
VSLPPQFFVPLQEQPFLIRALEAAVQSSKSGAEGQFITQAILSPARPPDDVCRRPFYCPAANGT